MSGNCEFHFAFDDEYVFLWGGGGQLIQGGACSNSIRNLGMVGHIEDISVAKDQQGKKLGQIIIETLSGVAEKVGCYKVYISLELGWEA